MTSQEIRNWKNQRLNDLEQYDQFKDKQNLLKSYIKTLSDLMIFKSRYNRHKHKADQEHISNTLNVIESFITSIRLNALKGDTTMAKYLKFYCITLFDEVANTLDCNDEFAMTRLRLIDATEPTHDSTVLVRPPTMQINSIPPPTNKLFSAIEWATIFFYTNESNLLPENPTIKVSMEQFIKDNNVDTTLGNLKTKYYKAKKAININNNYPLHKLEKIIPFLKEHFPETVTKVENDITFLKENNSDN